MDALLFLEKLGQSTPQPIYVLYGDEDFLRRQSLAALRQHLLGTGEEANLGLTTFPGDKAIWSAVRDELDTLPFLAPRRLVVIEQADPFVTAHRAQLEKFVSTPTKNGTLVLDVKTWASNTKLYKMLDGPGSVSCKAPPGAKLAEWCRHWCATQHDKQLAVPASQLLLELIGPEMGLLDQELAKLATYAGDRKQITVEDVDLLVGNSRTENTFRIFDLLAAGKAADALQLLDKLLQQGEQPVALLGAFGWQLRKLAAAARLNAQGVGLGEAISRCGLFKAREAEQLMRHLGRRRLDQLFDWLLQVDLGLKGGCELDRNLQMERLIARIAHVAQPAGK